ncbi:hypothetical protein ABZX75_11865 [Streptomyces sp. NPDC003038]|uniref:hypothetical protein n=1 Tax=unclassified Streptomyces TaxID=2593676 RepID=UPI0033BC0081
MRLSRTLTAGAALVALVSLTGCGGGGDGATDDLGLPSAGDIASIEKLVNQYATCDNLRPRDEKEDRWGTLAKDPAWAIKERARCDDDSNQNITLLAISDMAKFQAANRKASEGGKNNEALIGKNFAIVAEGDETGQALMKAKMLILTCSGDYPIPGGYKQHKGLAEGCVLTDYNRS